MKRLRIVIRVITGVLVVLTVAGIVILVANQKLDFLDTTYEIIAFSIGMGGMIMAVVSQIDSYQQEKNNKKMLDELSDLNRAADNDDKVDSDFQKKLDTLISQSGKIYSKLGKK
ncbi:MAG: hypothetical protein LBG75_01695 [Candidatus Nomurabacteria bacterium]|jgi:hypothetical protein|nr:hypothetical protein [Candidatus Nomurabacteria bacterium]